MISRLHLGSSPSCGNASVTQCSTFKRKLRETIGRVEGASLLTVQHDQRMVVEVVYPSDNPLAEAWAKEAKEVAESVWKLVEHSNTRQMLRG
ncbi:hypothetical protein J8F10_24005 [Gemmata sp. G18]|uniref:Uncharacterized protein n=1 Tax=Gemmata palustris TaxID=2822762 RepID=A0ABS5BX92_9BACT|nr:hypothetical protein [Gemmata palustris]MBP3958324.1 hypothetical protein [Gemmata palustris]